MSSRSTMPFPTKSMNLALARLYSITAISRFNFSLMAIFAVFGLTVMQPSSPIAIRGSPYPMTSLFSPCGKIAQDDGDCQAIGPRRPVWDCPQHMRKALLQFRDIYVHRPFFRNNYGMRVEHSFALWYTLRSLRPTPSTVVENGVHQGHSTWLIKKALPQARIISIDPNVPSHTEHGVEYFVGKNFTDFNKIDWNSRHLDPEKTVIFFDDHQSSFRRILKEGRLFGFKRYMIDDNYDLNEGDNYSLKQACERNRKVDWLGEIWDNFKKTSINMTWDEHLENGALLEKYVRVYYEFPPIVPSGMFTEPGVPFGKKHRTTALYSKKEDVTQLNIGDGHEFVRYTHFSYVQIE